MLDDTRMFRAFLKHRYAIIGAITGLTIPTIKSLGDYYLFSSDKMGFFQFVLGELMDPQQLFDYTLLTVMPVIMMGLGGILFAKLVHAQHIAYKDALTGAYNKGYLPLTENRLRKEKNTFTLAMIDLDNFKPINDKFGHHVGDEALRKVYDVLDKKKRHHDTIIRYGGDEFIMILPETNLAGARSLLKRIRKQVNKIQYGDLVLGFSMGLAMEREAQRTKLQELIKIADKRMYEDKSRKHMR